MDEIEKSLVERIPGIEIAYRSFSEPGDYQMTVKRCGVTASVNFLPWGMHVYKWGSPNTDRIIPYGDQDAIGDVINHLVKMFK